MNSWPSAFSLRLRASATLREEPRFAFLLPPSLQPHAVIVFDPVDRRHFASLLGLSLILGCKPAGTTRRLVVGMELGYPPFEMMDEKGRPAGVSVDLARALADGLQRDLVIENIAFDGLIPALKTGKIDLILSIRHYR